MWFPVKLEVQFRICAPNMLYFAALLKPLMYNMFISLLLCTPSYLILYIACGAEKPEKKINKKFKDMCYIFYKMSGKQYAESTVIPSLMLLSPLRIRKQKQVLNVCYFLTGLSTARNLCDNQRTCEYMCKCFGLFPNCHLFNATTA